MRCIVSFGSTSFPWLIFSAALLWGSMIHKHTWRWMWQGSARVVSCLSFQIGLDLVSAAIVCAVLECISGLDSSSDATEPSYFKLVTVSSFCLFTLISLSMPLVLFVISLVFSALISMPKAVEALSRRSTNFASSSSSPVKPSMSSTKRWLVNVLPSVLTVPSWSGQNHLARHS